MKPIGSGNGNGYGYGYGYGSDNGNNYNIVTVKQSIKSSVDHQRNDG